MYQIDYGIEDILNLLGIPCPAPRQGTNEIVMTCPFCGKKKKFAADLSNNVWHCYYCNKDSEIGGGMYHLYALQRGLPDAKAAKKEIEERLYGTSGKKEYRRIPVKHTVKVDDEPAPIERRDKAYRALLPLLRLSDVHREKLYARGLSDSDIEKGMYRSIPYKGFSAIAGILRDNGTDLSHVPGFLYSRHSGWTLTNSYDSGIMIPVCDYFGRIEGFQIRFDNPKDPHNKYMWLSTVNRPQGARTHAWVHIAGNPEKSVYITEGPLKANVIHALSGFTVIAVPGVNSISYLGPTLDYFKSNGTESVVSAFDMDLFKNPVVLRAFKKMNCLITNHGLSVKLIRWDSNFKGLDDFLLSQTLKKINCTI
jgi:DNA primase